jgi:hypothetical protein
LEVQLTRAFHHKTRHSIEDHRLGYELCLKRKVLRFEIDSLEWNDSSSSGNLMKILIVE